MGENIFKFLFLLVTYCTSLEVLFLGQDETMVLEVSFSWIVPLCKPSSV